MGDRAVLAVEPGRGGARVPIAAEVVGPQRVEGEEDDVRPSLPFGRDDDGRIPPDGLEPGVCRRGMRLEAEPDGFPGERGQVDVLVGDSRLFTAALTEHKGRLCLTSFSQVE